MRLLSNLHCSKTTKLNLVCSGPALNKHARFKNTEVAWATDHVSILSLVLELTITLKMADQRWSDIYVVFTKILCGHNFRVWVSYKVKIHSTVSNGFIESLSSP